MRNTGGAEISRMIGRSVVARVALASMAGAAALGLLWSGGSTATPPMARADGTPVVVELFTSQSCYSCPPAEALLADLALRDGVVALEHHVDYWDSLVYGSAGRWKDVFSSPEATARQRAYNAVVPGRGHSYTPQMVIDGRYEAVGSRDGEVARAIRNARAAAGPRLAVSAVARGDAGLRIRVRGTLAADGGQPAAVWLVRYLRQHVTRVTAGENHGKTLTGRNIVREMTRIGDWRGADIVIDLDAAKPDAGHGCAVLVQPDGPGPIQGAAYCDLGAAASG